MSKASLYTFIALLALAFADLGLLVFGGIEGTVSSWVVKYSPKMPIIVFTIGAVCGHLFWPMKIKDQDIQ
jgi:hypothetical protein